MISFVINRDQMILTISFVSNVRAIFLVPPCSAAAPAARWWRGQHQMRWCCCAVAGVSLTVSTAPQSRASYRHTRWSHDASVNGAIRYSFTSYSPRIHTFPLGINVWAKCIHSNWIWSTSRMWTNSAKMQWNRWIVKLPLQNPEEVFWSLWIKITEKLFCCNSGLAGVVLLWEAIMTVLLVVTPRSFRDGATV